MTGRLVIDVGDWDPRDMDPRNPDPRDEWPTPSDLADDEREPRCMCGPAGRCWWCSP